MKNIAFALFLVLFLTQCTKFGKNISVEGRLLNPLTGEGIAEMEIYMSRSKSSTIEGGGKKVKTSTTDADGYFRMDRLGVLEGHSVNAGNVTNMYHLGWFSEDGEELTKSAKLGLPKGKTTRANYYVVPFGKMKIALNAVNCEGPSDILVYERNYITDPSYSGFIPLTFTGCYNNPGAFAEVPSGYYQIKLTITRSGITSVIEQQIFVPGNGEYETLINY